MAGQFEDVVFPELKLIHGLKKSISEPVTIVGNGVKEYRIKKRQYPRKTWSFPGRALSDTDKNEIAGFLSEREHGLNSFKFIDPEMPTLDNALLPVYDVTDANKRLISPPYSSSVPGRTPIFNIIDGDESQYTVTKNGAPLTTFDFAFVRASNGAWLLNVANTGINDVIRITGPYWYAVRLESSFENTLAALNTSNMPTAHIVDEIKLVEVHEY